MTEFLFKPETHVMGPPCRNGHKGIRYKSTGICCECLRSYGASRKPYLKEYNKKRLTTPAAMATRLFLSTRNRHRHKFPDIPFGLSKEWIMRKLIKGKCEATGISFDYSPTKTHKRPFAPSIDKIDPSKPYVESNCQVVCFIYNVAKSEFHHEDVMTLAKALTKSVTC